MKLNKDNLVVRIVDKISKALYKVNNLLSLRHPDRNVIIIQKEISITNLQIIDTNQFIQLKEH